MTGFAPVVPVSGYAGWKFLQRTMETQRNAYVSGKAFERDEQYVRDNLAKADTAEALVADKRLLRIALSAYGLEADADKAAYILKVLEEGTDDPKAFANRIVDKRYREFAKDFGYGNLAGARTSSPGFADRLLENYRIRKFEAAVGETDSSMRLSMGFVRTTPEMAASSPSEATFVYRMLGNPPVREVLETAFALPSGFGQLDIDRQSEIVTDRLHRIFGDDLRKGFQDRAKVEKLLQQFFLQKQIQESPVGQSGGMVAVTLLTQTANNMESFFQSRLTQ